MAIVSSFQEKRRQKSKEKSLFYGKIFKKLGNTKLYSIQNINFGTVSCFEEKVSLIR